MKKIAVIGASSGQLPIVKKAKELGIITYCFAWEKGAVCKDICDKFFPISIFETDAIINICKQLDIDGVVTNASEETVLIASIVAESLGLNSNSVDIIKRIQDKKTVRRLTNEISELSKPIIYDMNSSSIGFPCVIKPVKGSAKKGVTYCESMAELESAINYAHQFENEILIEEYIGGSEYSVESISYHGQHQVVQITQKITSGYPHFVELEHHQPANINESLRLRIVQIIDKVLSAVGFLNGASHIEIKINYDKIYLIEINPRGGGDRISDTLTSISTNCDYLKCMIEVALDDFHFEDIHNVAYSGIIFLCKQNENAKKYFIDPMNDCIIEKYKDNLPLRDAVSNYDRNGYLIYKTNTPLNK